MSDEDLIISGDEAFLFQRRYEAELKPPGLPVVTQAYVGWSMADELTTRNSVSVPVPPKQLQLQCSFDRQMQTHTVQFNAPDNDVVLTGTGIICEAEIIWAVEGNTVRRYVSVADGLAISGEAQSVTVNIFDMSLTNTVRAYRVGCNVAPGVRPDTQQPPTLRVSGFRSSGGVTTGPFPFAGTLTPGDVMSYTIPPNVGAISSYVALSAPNGSPQLGVANDFSVRHETASGAIVREYGIEGCFRFVPLYGGVRTIRITNNRATNILVSHLLGIEG